MAVSAGLSVVFGLAWLVTAVALQWGLEQGWSMVSIFLILGNGALLIGVAALLLLWRQVTHKKL